MCVMSSTAKSTTHRYGFNLPWPPTILGGIFYAGLSVYMLYLARDFVGVIFVGLISLSASSAILCVFMWTRRLVSPRLLELTDDAILYPRGFPRTRIVAVPYADILRVTDHGEGAQIGLTVVSGRGEFAITASYFKRIEDYHAAKDFICTKASIAIPRQDQREALNWGDWRIWGFPEPILRWNEPEEWPRYRTHLATSKPLLPRLGKALWFFVRCFGIILLPWFLLSLFRVPTAPAAGYSCLAAAVSFFITLIYHWLASIWPVHCTEISFRERGITQFFGKQTMDRNYRDLTGWAVVEKQFEGRVLHIVLLQGRTWRGRTYVQEFALPDTNTRDRLVQLLNDKHIPQSSDLKLSWEDCP
jgi:hypothetical protein